jgi:hypothetical protein
MTNTNLKLALGVKHMSVNFRSVPLRVMLAVGKSTSVKFGGKFGLVKEIPTGV